MSYLGTKPSNQTPTYKQVYEYTATAGQITFTASYTVGFVSVFRNGVQLNSADYTATNGTSVVLANAASSGDAIRIESVFTANVQGAIPNTAGAVVTSNIADANVTQAKLATGVAGTGPAFSAYISTQSVSADTATKMAYNNEVFDTASCYNNTGSTVGSIPAYSFLPNVAGYYQVNMSSYWASYTGGGFVNIALYKNGTGYTEYTRFNATSGTMSGSGLVYLNGTTDYISAYWYAASGGCTLVASNGSFFSNFSAVLVKAA